MKGEMTFYEVLDVPSNASPADIRTAYRQLQSIYDSDSLSTYSLFSDTERQAILDQAEEAFATLTHPRKRADYDRKLISRGRLDGDMCYGTMPEGPAPVFRPSEAGEEGMAEAGIREKADHPEVREMKARFMAGNRITGPGLRDLRRAAGISLTDIFEASRVSVATLEAIEGEDLQKLPAEIYLKGFLKSYAQCLGLDPGAVVSGYFSHLSDGENPVGKG